MSQTPPYPSIDLAALAAASGVDLSAALENLDALYADIDAKNAANTAALDLPCHDGCSACCEHAVFISPLEFFGAWDYAQRHLSADDCSRIVGRGLALFAAHAPRMEAVEGAASEGEREAQAQALHFRCPFLDEGGGCQVYPRRELLGRLFGQSFNEDHGVYGCELVGAQLAERTVTLLRAKPAAAQINALPLTETRHVIPWYFRWLYGARDDEGKLIDAPPAPRSLPVISG